MGRIVWTVTTFIVLAGLYLFLAGSVDAVEAVAMLVCAAAGTVLAVALTIVAKRSFSPRPPPRAILHPLATLLPELVLVGRELAVTIVTGRTTQRGELVEQSFEPGDDEPRAAGRRALTVVGVSLPPRSFVVRGERTPTLLLHTLPAKPPSADHAWPA